MAVQNEYEIWIQKIQIGSFLFGMWQEGCIYPREPSIDWSLGKNSRDQSKSAGLHDFTKAIWMSI